MVDPRTVKPLDTPLILESVKKTGRLVVTDTSWKTCGMASEVAAVVVESGFASLKAPIRRVALPDVPTPASSALEALYYPGCSQIVEAVCQVLGKEFQPFKHFLESAAPAENPQNVRQPF